VRVRTAAALATAGFVAHAAPSVTALPPVRRRVAPAWHAVGAPGHVALTFDDGPDPVSTPRVVDELDRLGVKATFFMLGSMVRLSPGLAAEVAAAGHEVAVHGDVHVSELWRSPGAVVTDLLRARDAVAHATGSTPRWFRPPYGIVSSAGPVAARRAGLRLVLWTTWGRDWRAAATPSSVVADVSRDLCDGATVLLHDSDCTSDPGAWRAAVGALQPLTELVRARGWRIGPLAEHGL